MDRSQEVLAVERMYLGELTIGVGGIATEINIETDRDALFAEGQSHMVTVDTDRTACCIDGRCAICLQADVDGDGFIDFAESQFEKVPVVPKVPGGLVHHTTMMAIGGNWAPLANVKSFDEAQDVVRSFLAANDMYDTRHSSVLSYKDAEKTECGAVDKDQLMATEAATESALLDTQGIKGPVNVTMDALVGEDETAQKLFAEVRRNHAKLATAEFFADSSSARDRDSLPGDNVELLESDAEHPTHLHVEQGIVINTVDGTTIDRDSNNGRLFWYDKWFNDKLAALMGGTDLEVARLALAGDYHTITVAHQLVAPGMPTELFKAAA